MEMHVPSELLSDTIQFLDGSQVLKLWEVNHQFCNLIKNGGNHLPLRLISEKLIIQSRGMNILDVKQFERCVFDEVEIRIAYGWQGPEHFKKITSLLRICGGKIRAKSITFFEANPICDLKEYFRWLDRTFTFDDIKFMLQKVPNDLIKRPHLWHFSNATSLTFDGLFININESIAMSELLNFLVDQKTTMERKEISICAMNNPIMLNFVDEFGKRAIKVDHPEKIFKTMTFQVDDGTHAIWRHKLAMFTTYLESAPFLATYKFEDRRDRQGYISEFHVYEVELKNGWKMEISTQDIPVISFMFWKFCILKDQ